MTGYPGDLGTLLIALDFHVFVSARYSRDPYNMLDQLEKMNLKHVKVKNDRACATNKLMLFFVQVALSMIWVL